ncbi:MAG: hypothetical protein K0R61_143 [Microvirga sp.]|jgi:hypothetical protein|nr:hypothetical protein [Microvirga sp.]
MWKERTRFLLIVSVLGVTVGTVAFFGALDRRPPRDEIFGHMHKPAYRPGDDVTGQWEPLVLRQCDGRTTRWLTTRADPLFVVNLPSEDVIAPLTAAAPLPARIIVGIAPFTLPPMPPGIAFYHRRTVFMCNWLQRLFPALGITIDYPVIQFEALPDPKSDSFGVTPPHSYNPGLGRGL